MTLDAQRKRIWNVVLKWCFCRACSNGDKHIKRILRSVLVERSLNQTGLSPSEQTSRQIPLLFYQWFRLWSWFVQLEISEFSHWKGLSFCGAWTCRVHITAILREGQGTTRDTSTRPAEAVKFCMAGQLSDPQALLLVKHRLKELLHNATNKDGIQSTPLKCDY